MITDPDAVAAFVAALPWTPPSNPIVKRTALRAYPGWEVREYKDGSFDAANDVALSPVVDTFHAAVAFARTGEPA